MTHEQKPESAEFRTTEEHVLALRLIIDETRVPDRLPVALAHVRAAEARGAAEQRRKDAEGAELWEFQEPEYHAQGMGCGLEDRGIHDRYQAMEYGWDQAIERCIESIPEVLYARPANVAALIAEAVAAERERCAKMLDASAIRADEQGAHWGERYAKCWAAAIREGGV